MSYPAWDFKISRKEFKKILKEPADARFPLFMARLLSRVPFRDVFHGFITPAQFKRNYRKVRRLMSADLLGTGRIPFWDWVYKKL